MPTLEMAKGIQGFGRTGGAKVMFWRSENSGKTAHDSLQYCQANWNSF